MATLLAAYTSTSSAQPGEPRPTLVVTQTPVSNIGGVAAPPPDAARLVLVDGDGHARPFLDGFASAGFADVSFDGKRLLFVGRRSSSDQTSVWEFALGSGDLRRVVDGPGECLKAIYLPAIYTIDADRPADQIAILAVPSNETAPALFTCGLNGERIRRITFAPRGVTGPTLLADGRLIFAMPTESGHGLDTSLFSVNTDGTDLFPFAALHGPVARHATPCKLPDDRIAFVESDPGQEEVGGAIFTVHRTRSLEPPVRLTSDGAGTFRSPCCGPAGRLFVSHRAGVEDSYGVVQLDPNTGVILDTVFDDPAWHDLYPRVVGPHLRPPGRSSVVDDQRDTGQLYCLDAYMKDLSRNEPGTISHVRVLHRLPGSSTDATLGEIPVEVDGSFFIELPARAPFRLETLDADRSVLHSMRTWMWVMPNERRGCVGCHEDRSLTPPNRHVLALRRRPHRLQAKSAATTDNGSMERVKP